MPPERVRPETVSGVRMRLTSTSLCMHSGNPSGLPARVPSPCLNGADPRGPLPHGEALFREIARHDQEGIVAKRIDAPYRAGRQSSWLKIKNRDYSRRGGIEWQGG